ncbi:hypothetical protein CCY99_05845 [Helicobacter sp. 16-1353]|uniref:50S ribosomal protein L11 methyltransferase n=1 Tax=Helicobacter sp. 16-1353 TaxID=2004996 RepID=UPI000DCC4DA6|nr:50S ribosomal protein L11 methyltransferase [Helicobacter sp. 16-1353]RAX53901.1 hypothetical protein CCY99_05845 [Helicobacter sp. 16-1353]
MSGYYFEICIKPNCFSDIFMSEILDFTSQAVEIVEETGQSVTNNNKNFYIIIRTDKNIENPLIAYLQTLSENLSIINSTNVDFTYTITKKQSENYIEKYKDSITAVDCGIFHIYPTWLEKLDSKINIILEPSLAFGTGHHSSTFMCIDVLQSLNITPSTTLLDVGCGSGILALCANKLGAKVSMCDIDELAIEEAKKNFSKNNATISQIWLGTINNTNKQYDIVVANIVASVIIEEKAKLIRSLNNNAYLVLSGILDIYLDSLKECFKSLTLVEEKIKDEWACLVYKNINLASKGV